MSTFIEIRALGGTHFIRAAQVIAVQYTEAQKCMLLMAGGGTVSCAEPAVQIKTRIDAAIQAASEVPHGDGSR